MRLLRLAAVMSLLGVSLVAACKEDEPLPPPAGDGQAYGPSPGGASVGSEAGTNTEGGATFDAGDGSVCNAIALTGLVIDRVGRNEELPISTGGIVSDGRYDLTDYVVFVGLGGIGGPTGVTGQASLVVNAGRIEEAIKFGGNTPATEQRTLAAYTAAGSTLSLTNICPSNGGTNQVQFSASETQLVLRDTVTKEAFTFTKR